ncbi:hypothetical protein RI054_03g16290 [Pseudoscourfieldia marina]
MTVSLDGHKDTRKRYVWTLSKLKPKLSLFEDVVYAGTSSKGSSDAMTLARPMLSDPDAVAVVVDNTSSMVGFLNKVREEFPNLIAIGCCVHVTDLFIEDIADIEEIAELVDLCRFIVRTVTRTDFLKEYFLEKKEKTAPSLKSFPFTRFCYAYLMLISVAANWNVIMTLVQTPRFLAMVDNAGRNNPSSSLKRGDLSRDIAAVIDGALPIDAELDAIDAKVAKAMQFVRKVADALAVANVGKVGVAVQIAHDYGTGPHGEAQALIGRSETTRTYASEGGMTDFEYVTGWSMLRSTLPKNAKDFEWLVQRDVQELEDAVSDIVCLWNKPAHDCKRTYGGSSTIAGEVTHATISIWLGDGNALAKARAAIAAIVDVAPPPSSFEVMAAYLSPMARWTLFKSLPDEKLNEIANLLDKHVEKNTYTTQHWSLRAKELRDITHSRKGKAIAAAAGAGAGEGC